MYTLYYCHPLALALLTKTKRSCKSQGYRMDQIQIVPPIVNQQTKVIFLFKEAHEHNIYTSCCHLSTKLVKNNQKNFSLFSAVYKFQYSICLSSNLMPTSYWICPPPMPMSTSSMISSLFFTSYFFTYCSLLYACYAYND